MTSGFIPTAALADNPAESLVPPVAFTTSRHFPAWLAELGASLAFTTYRAGKLFMIGLQTDGRLSIFERTFNRAMGLCGSADTLFLATLYQLWRLDNTLAPGQLHDGYDRLYVPQVAWTTGNLDVHGITIDGRGRLVFVNTLFNCLAAVSEGHSFVPLWRPPFVSRLAAEDRCHLNGLALKDGRQAYVTAVSRADVADGWRDRRQDGGVVIDVASNEIAAEGLSMPHSPRWHDGRLWLLESGTGYLGTVDLDSGRFERVAFCPGYARGLVFIGNYAVVGLSKPRQDDAFQGLALEAELAKRDGDARCGLWVVDLRSGEVAHWLRINGLIEELYDVAILPGARRPMALGLKTDEIQHVLSVADPEPL